MSHERLIPPGLAFSELRSRREEMSEALGSFSKRNIKDGKRLTKSFVENTPKDMQTSELVVADLIRIRDRYEDQGLGASTPLLTASFIADVVEKSVQALFEDEDPKNPTTTLKFCSYFDFATGCFMVTDSLRLTEDAIRGALPGKVDEIIGAEPVTPEVKLAVVRNLAQYEELLKSDNTGRELVSAVVRGLEKKPEFGIDFVNRELAIEGARFAQSAYNVVYPIAERVNRAA